MAEFTILTHQHDTLGEGPIWIARENALYWVDIIGERLHCHRLGDGETTSWAMPEPICWLVERADMAGFMAGFQSGMASLSLDPLVIGERVPLRADMAGHRLNDAKVDPAGRLWAGVMQQSAATPTGSFHRIERDAPPACVDEGYLVPNGPAFSLDGGYLYHADSPRGIVYRFAVADDGSLADRRAHIRFADDWGLPDGMTVDAEGYLWVAHWDGSRISRFDPDGVLDRAVMLPASRITSCAFGGAGLDRLFVTSAAFERGDEALAGAVFEIDPGTTGVAPIPFAG